MKKLLSLFAVAALAVMAAVSCKPEVPEVLPEGIELDQTSVTLDVGGTVTLTATIKPADVTNKPEVTWTSSSDAVATVAAGVVTAVGPGTAVITAKADKFSATCNVTVVKPDTYEGPVQGSAAWSVIGALLDTNWDTDFVCAEASGGVVLKNVRLSADNMFKFRKDKKWDDNRGINEPGVDTVIETAVPTKAVPNGGNIKVKADGYYDLWYFEDKEAIVVLATGATLPEVPSFKEAPDTWDYTPAGYYQDASNLWKPVDDAKAVKYFYYSCNGADWNGAETESDAPDFLTVKESTYRLHYAANTASRWQNQFFIHPEGADHYVPMKEKTLYNLKVTLGTTKDFTGFFKIAQYDPNTAPKHEGPTIWELGEVELKADAPVTIEQEGIVGPGCDNVMLVMDFGGNPAEVFVYIKDITLVEAGSAAPTVSDFIALADDAEGTFEGIVAAIGKNGIVVTDGAQNLYVFKPATTPAVGDKVSITAKKTTYYGLVEAAQGGTVEVLSSGNQVPQTAVVDITETFDAYPDNAPTSDFVKFAGKVVKSGNYINIEVEGATRQGSPQGLDVSEFDGKKVAISGYYVGTSGTGGKYVNVIVTDVAEVVDPNAWDFTPGAEYLAENNLWKPADEAHTIEWYFNPGWAGEKPSPESTFQESTYTVTMNEDTNGDWQAQMWIRPTSPITLSMNKTYTFKATVFASKDAPIFMKGYQKGVDVPVAFEVSRTPLSAGVITTFEVKDFVPGTEEPMDILIDFGGASSGTIFRIKDITLVETGTLATGITIDGNFDDWADIPTAEPAGLFKAFKVFNDADNFYFYVETDPGSRLWSGGAYLYLYFNFKNDLTQGEYGGSTGMGDNKYDAYTFMYLFGGSADAPKIEDNPNGGEAKGLTLDNVVIAGNQPATASDIVMMEIVIPRANFTTQVNAGDVIEIDSYRSKDGGNIYFPGYVVK